MCNLVLSIIVALLLTGRPVVGQQQPAPAPPSPPAPPTQPQILGG